jgi:PKD repeat protein
MIKNLSPFKTIFFTTILIGCFVSARSQKPVEAYSAEAEGYFTGLSITTKGPVFTNNKASSIYVAVNNQPVVLISSPGCGRYYSVSPDKSKIGFKYIQSEGMQVPAIYDLNSGSITLLAPPADLCGQISFSTNGKMAFTVGDSLYVKTNNNIISYNLGVYSNIAPISPDGNYVIYNNNNDQLFELNLSTGLSLQITDNSGSYAYPCWSPDGSKISFKTLPGILMVWEKSSGTIYNLGNTENESWSSDSRHLLFNRNIFNNSDLISSDIFMIQFDGTSLENLTKTENIHEIAPVQMPDKSIAYSIFGNKEILISSPDKATFLYEITDTLVQCSETILPQINESAAFTQKLAKAITMLPGDVPYVHQRWDTPDWHAGSGSCAPSTAIMALGYFNRLPHWDITCASNPTNHISHYGAYVADKYRFNEIYYDTQDTAYGTLAWGGYGYMWGLGSPNSYMHTYIQNHGVTSVHSTSTTYQNVTDEIDNGYPFSICNLLSTAGHLTLAVGYVIGQHTLIFNDPYGNKNDGSWGSLNNGKNSYYDWPGYSNGYQNLNTMAWTVTSETSEPFYNDTIIDDVYYNHGFYMHNEDPSMMRYFRDTKLGGYNSHFWYTYSSASTTADTCYVTWTPNLATAGNYEVFAYIPTSNASATAAKYKVYYNGGMQTVIINQAPIYGQWVSLGTYPFVQGSTGYVRLGDATGTASQKIAFDAVKFSKRAPVPLAGFNASSVSICQNNSVQFTNTSTDATNYNWIFSGGTPATSTQTNPLITYNNSGNYTVELRATGAGGSDTLINSNMITVNPLPNAVFTVSDTLIFLPGAPATFINSSQNANSYIWNFGDGQTSTVAQPTHTYTNTGTYTVTLIAHSNSCGNDTLIFTDLIDVVAVTGIETIPGIYALSVSPNPSNEQLYVSFESPRSELIEITLFDISGKATVIMPRTMQDAGNHLIKVDLKKNLVASGIYMLQISGTSGKEKLKVVVM